MQGDIHLLSRLSHEGKNDPDAPRSGEVQRVLGIGKQAALVVAHLFLPPVVEDSPALEVISSPRNV